MALNPIHPNARLQQMFSRAAFEAHAVKQHPPLPLGIVSINGQFDRYFHPHTQATWEGRMACRQVAHDAICMEQLNDWKWQPRERMLISLNSDHLQKEI